MNIEKNKTKVLIFAGQFFPDETSGGPAVSIRNLAGILDNELDLYILASNKTFVGGKPLNVQIDIWIENKNFKAMYLNKVNPIKISNIINSLKPDVIYLNSFFSFQWTLIPLILFSFNKAKYVIAPRGNFSSKAFDNKRIKKTLYLKLFKIIHFNSNIRWHFTSKSEFNDAQDYIGKLVLKNCHYIIENVPTHNEPCLLTEKKSNHLKILYFGRIHKKKNILESVESVISLSDLKNLKYDIYGTIEDIKYFDSIQRKFDHRIRYMGAYNHSDLKKFICKYHLFLFPTRGENYGHTIVESLSFGLPIIISKYTPWSKLNNIAGYTVAINNLEEIQFKIRKLYKMDNEKWQVLRTGAINSFNDIYKINTIKNKYLKLFKNH